jgi:ATP-dependent DNA helicase RecG
MRLSSVDEQGFGELFIPDVTWRAAREAALNGLVHRDWFLHQSVMVELRPDRLEVVSPGGFIGGVRTENVLRHPPVRRNPLLAATFQAIGYVNRAGLGVDRMYEDLLRLGKGVPRFEADESTVSVKLPTSTNAPFARFVAAQAKAGRELDLDDLILLWAATQHGQVDRWSGARHLQLSEADAADRLASLRRRSLLVARGRGRSSTYQLATSLSDLLRGRIETDLELRVDEVSARLRVQAVLAERGSLSNAEVRRMTGLSREGVLQLMSSLRAELLAEVEGRGRGARWVAGPRLARAPRRGK